MKKESIIQGYFADKFRGEDERQLNALSDEQRNILFNGSDDEVIETIKGIRTRERLQKTTLLGEAAMEFVADVRAMRQQRTAIKESCEDLQNKGTIFGAIRKFFK